MAKHAATLGFVLSNLLDAGLDSINNALKLPAWKAGAPVKGQGRSGNRDGCLIRPNQKESRRKSELFIVGSRDRQPISRRRTVRDTTRSSHSRWSADALATALTQLGLGLTYAGIKKIGGAYSTRVKLLWVQGRGVTPNRDIGSHPCSTLFF